MKNQFHVSDITSNTFTSFYSYFYSPKPVIFPPPLLQPVGSSPIFWFRFRQICKNF